MSTSSTTSDDDHIAPVLGSAYLTSQSLIPPALPTDQFSPSLCLNISLFKSTLKKYRGLDDQIMVRLNRDAALHRGDAMATGELGSAERKTCLRIWREMTGTFFQEGCFLISMNAETVTCAESWKRREAVIRYCVKSTDDRLESREVELQRSNVSTRYSAEKLDANRSDRIREDLFSEQVKVRFKDRMFYIPC